jgi:hypothetical protein
MPHYRVLPPTFDSSTVSPVSTVGSTLFPVRSAKYHLSVQTELRQKALKPRSIGAIYLVPAMIAASTLATLGLWFLLST